MYLTRGHPVAGVHCLVRHAPRAPSAAHLSGAGGRGDTYHPSSISLGYSTGGCGGGGGLRVGSLLLIEVPVLYALNGDRRCLSTFV